MVSVRRVSLAALGSVLVLVGAGVAASPVLAVGDANEAACPNEASPGFRSYLPDCRGYELVTPSFAEGFKVEPYKEARDGEHFIVASLGSFAGTEDQTLLSTEYELSRSGGGWLVQALDPSASEYPGLIYLTASADLSSTLWEAESVKRPAEGIVLYKREADGRFVEVGPVFSNGSLNQPPPGVFAASSDLNHIFFEVNEGLWPGDTTSTRPSTRPSLYEYGGVGNSEPRLVGVNNKGVLDGHPHVNEGAELISQCGTRLGNPRTSKYNAVSADGETAFFTAECGRGASEVYARVGGASTIAISEPSLSVPGRVCSGVCREDEEVEDKRSPAYFEGASEDGSRVFFTTTQPLVNEDEDSSNNLYEAVVGNGGVERLIDVSHDPNSGQVADLLGVARISEDGSHVYFVDSGVLTEGSDGQQGEFAKAHEGADNLYVYSEGRTQFIAMLCSGSDVSGEVTDSECHGSDATVWREADSGRPAEATPDGRFIVFESAGDITGDDTSTVKQLFEYDASTERLVRVSVGQKSAVFAGEDGYDLEGHYNSNGNTEIEANSPTINVEGFAAVSDDGQYVFFQSADGLTPQASNGALVGVQFGQPQFAHNVYEYHDGNVFLVSDGQDLSHNTNGQSNVGLIGTDASGHDVLFSTLDALVPQDDNTQVDFYDARVDGGFGSVGKGLAGCQGEDCQGSLGVTPAPSLAGSVSMVGGGNLTPVTEQPRTIVKAKSLTRAQKLTRALQVCRKKPRKKQQAVCKARARRRYGSSSKAKRSNRRGN